MPLAQVKTCPRTRRDGGWTAGVGASYRVLRFRLSDTGPVSNGVGQECCVRGFLSVTRNFPDQMPLHLYGGVVAAGKLHVENSSGNKPPEEDFDPAPLSGATFIGRFWELSLEPLSLFINVLASVPRLLAGDDS